MLVEGNAPPPPPTFVTVRLILITIGETGKITNMAYRLIVYGIKQHGTRQ